MIYCDPICFIKHLPLGILIIRLLVISMNKLDHVNKKIESFFAHPSQMDSLCLQRVG